MIKTKSLKSNKQYATLSIVIPIYNWNVKNLVLTLYNQCIKLKIQFEIICVEDGSENTFENNKIKKLKYVTYKILSTNIGRSKIRNLLAKKAQSQFILFIDSDSCLSQNDNFIEKYLKESLTIKSHTELIYGQTLYALKKPKHNKLLHWTYGREIESRYKKYNFSSHHFLCKKTLFNKYQFNENIDSYGYEDVDFRQGKKIKYINNPLYHVGLKNTEKFIRDTESALRNINTHSTNSKIFNIWTKISMMWGDKLVYCIFKIFKTLIIYNLKSNSPSMLIFQFYKLGYFCGIKYHYVQKKTIK